MNPYSPPAEEAYVYCKTTTTLSLVLGLFSGVVGAMLGSLFGAFLYPELIEEPRGFTDNDRECGSMVLSQMIYGANAGFIFFGTIGAFIGRNLKPA